MKWPNAKIGRVCLPTEQSDPGKSPDSLFQYIDIASIGKDSKSIVAAQSILGQDAPSRARKIVRAGDVLVSTVRPNLNAVAMVPAHLDGEIASTGFCVLRPNPNLVDGKYLFFRTVSTDFISYLIARAKGASYPAVSDGIIKQAEIPLPAPSEQRRIVEILDQADQLRKLRVEADKKAERILPALFNKMFGDPATNPMGWKTERLDQLFDVAGGGTPSKTEPKFWNGTIPWVSPKDMKQDVIRVTEDGITAEAISCSATRLVSKGSILIVYRSGILAHTFPVAIAGRELTINQDLKALSSKSELMNEYLYGWLIANPRIGLGCVKTGATVHNVDGQRFLALKVGKPPRPLQEQFAGQLEILLDQKMKREASGKQVESLFALLLQRAFSGTLTASWREAHMKELLAEMEQQAKCLI